MPNHIQNRLQIIAKKSVVEKISKSLEGQYEDGTLMRIDFNKIIECPSSLNIQSSSLGDLGLQVFHGCSDPLFSDEGARKRYESLDDNLKKEAKELGARYQSNLDQFGFKTWYGWNRQNWGTKWNAYGQNDNRDTFDTIWFETAWNAPIILIEKLSIKFPNATFQLDYADECTGYNVGKITINKGIITKRYQPEGGSKEAYEISFELNPGDRPDYQLVDGEYQYIDECF